MDRSRAKSSAAKISPCRRGVALHMEDRFMMARADSMSARYVIGFDGGDEVVVSEVASFPMMWLTASQTKRRSLAEWTLGITMVSGRWG